MGESTGGLRSPGFLTNSNWDEPWGNYSTILCRFFFGGFSSPFETLDSHPTKHRCRLCCSTVCRGWPTASRLLASDQSKAVLLSTTGGKWFQSHVLLSSIEIRWWSPMTSIVFRAVTVNPPASFRIGRFGEWCELYCMGVSENEVSAAQIYGILWLSELNGKSIICQWVEWETIFADKPIFWFPSKPRGYIVFP